MQYSFQLVCWSNITSAIILIEFSFAIAPIIHYCDCLYSSKSAKIFGVQRLPPQGPEPAPVAF